MIGKPSGKLARQYCGLRLELAVMKSAAGYYLGTYNDSGPVSRESEEYWRTYEEAKAALESGEWNQKETP